MRAFRVHIIATWLVVLTTIVSYQPAVASPAQAAEATSCTPVAIMAFRGSGERAVSAQDYRGVTSNGWEGPTLQRLLREYAYSDSWGPKLRRVPIVSLSAGDGYPAVDVDEFGEFFNDFSAMSKVWDSATSGSIAAIRKMGSFQRSQPAGCPRTKWVLVGYSQGAMAARWTYETMRSSWVSSLYLLGDPFQRGGKAGTRGSGRNGIGVMRFRYGHEARTLDNYYATKPATATSYCHAYDVICDFRAGSWVDQHKNYLMATKEKRHEGAVLGRIVSQAVADAEALVGPSTGGDVDIVFAIDTTGSMQDYIDEAVNSARTLGGQVRDLSPGSRVGLVEYRDHGDSFVTRTVVGLTRDVTAYENGLNRLEADEGGDTPEAVYSGMLEALRAGWAPGARRAVAVIGDAPAHDPEPVTEYTAAQVASRFSGVTAARRAARAPSGDGSGVGTLAFALTADLELADQLTPISREAGGGVYDIGADGSLTELMSEVVEEAGAAPTAVLEVQPSLSDRPTVISAAGSAVSVGDPVFDFDLDGDGTLETNSAAGTQTPIFSPGEHTVSVRVSDADGRATTISKTFTTVAPQEAFEPAIDPEATPVDVVLTGRPVAGRKLRVDLGDSVPAGQAFSAALVRASAPSPALGVPAAAAATGEAGQRLVLRVPRRVTPGQYRVEVLTTDGRPGSSAPVRIKQRPVIEVAKSVRTRVGRQTSVPVQVSTFGTRARGRVSAAGGEKILDVARLRQQRAVLGLGRFRKPGRYQVIVGYGGSKQVAPGTRTMAVRVRR